MGSFTGTSVRGGQYIGTIGSDLPDFVQVIVDGAYAQNIRQGYVELCTTAVDGVITHAYGDTFYGQAWLRFNPYPGWSSFSAGRQFSVRIWWTRDGVPFTVNWEP